MKKKVLAVILGGALLAGSVGVHAEMPQFTLNAFPGLDGSLACVPLGLALTQKLTGCTEIEAEMVLDDLSNTNPCYLRLAEGEKDVVLAYEPSEETKKELEAYEPLDMQEIGQDALVFLVNESNPVESLTEEQLKDIFSGKITNWKEVGGEDVEIRAFQRPENSGSQTLMRKLLIGDMEMVEERVTRISSMEGMLDEIMLYDNDANAIGYSVYYYAEEMMHKDGIRLLKVNGAAPSPETIYNGEYTLVNPFYCATGVHSSEGGKTIQSWLLTEEGQDFVEECGYVRRKADVSDAQ